MIFVTVGTHEQQFDRLIRCVDHLKRDNVIQEEVVMQIGFGTYEPKYCSWGRMLPYEEMERHIADARIVITHAGPSSFFMSLRFGKIPIVVPRQFAFHEHVNNHQVDFLMTAKDCLRNIIPVMDIGALKETIMAYDTIVSGMNCEWNENNEHFNRELKSLVGEMFDSRMLCHGRIGHSR